MKCLLALPDFELLKRQPKIPHVSRTIAERVVPNEHGLEIKYVVKQSRNGKDYWIQASSDGYRQSNTLHTTKRDIANGWIKAVNAGKVCIKP